MPQTQIKVQTVNPLAVALEGVGFEPITLASQGIIWYEIKIVVTPTVSSGVGGSGPGYLVPVMWGYNVDISVTIRGRKISKKWLVTDRYGMVTGRLMNLVVKPLLHKISAHPITVNKMRPEIFAKLKNVNSQTQHQSTK